MTHASEHSVGYQLGVVARLRPNDSQRLESLVFAITRKLRKGFGEQSSQRHVNQYPAAEKAEDSDEFKQEIQKTETHVVIRPEQ